MAGLDLPSLPHLQVSESKGRKDFTITQAPPQTTRRDRRMAWNRRALKKNMIEDPKRTNVDLCPTPTGTKTVTPKTSSTDRQCAKKQRPLPEPECSPQNEWTHSGSTRFAVWIGDPKMGRHFLTLPTKFFLKRIALTGSKDQKT